MQMVSSPVSPEQLCEKGLRTAGQSSNRPTTVLQTALCTVLQRAGCGRRMSCRTTSPGAVGTWTMCWSLSARCSATCATSTCWTWHAGWARQASSTSSWSAVANLWTRSSRTVPCCSRCCRQASTHACWELQRSDHSTELMHFSAIYGAFSASCLQAAAPGQLCHPLQRKLLQASSVMLTAAWDTCSIHVMPVFRNAAQSTANSLTAC